MNRQGLGVFHKKIVKVNAPGNLDSGSAVIVWDLQDYFCHMAIEDYFKKELHRIRINEKDPDKELHDKVFDALKNSDKPPGEAIKEAGFKVVITNDNDYIFTKL